MRAAPMTQAWTFLQLTAGMVASMVMFSQPTQAEDKWRLVKDEDGIKVYTQSIGGSGFKEFKGEVDVDATLQQCAGLLMSIPLMTKWMHGTDQVKLVSAVNERDRVLYIVQDAPFPVRDRDLFVRNTLFQQADNTVIYTMDLVANKVPDSGYVHVKGLRGRVIMTPLSSARTHIEYRAYVDPGGVVPSWAANMFVTDTPYYTLKHAREIIKTTKQSLLFGSIKNQL